MSSRTDDCVALLRSYGIALQPGLSPDELAAIERRLGIAFAIDHRELLRCAVPSGDRWPDWRSAPDATIRERLDWPTEGGLFDVEHGSFWAASWGPRPTALEAALATARTHFESWPTLIPVYGHRYLPAAPIGPGAPVFSVHQTDVIVYGGDLLDYIRREFGPPTVDHGPITIDVPPWSLLAQGASAADL